MLSFCGSGSLKILLRYELKIFITKFKYFITKFQKPNISISLKNQFITYLITKQRYNLFLKVLLIIDLPKDLQLKQN